MSDFTVKALILAGVVGGLVLLYWGISELFGWWQWKNYKDCLLYTSDAADE